MPPRTALLLCTALLVGCHDGAALPREPDEYTGCATDELWETFDGAREIVSDADAPVLIDPSPEAALGATPPDFVWHASPTVDGAPAGDVAMSCSQWSPGFSTLHLPPVSGTVFDLQLSAAGALRHRVLTTLQRWRASDEVWRAFAGARLSVRVRRMVVLLNAREAGPYVAAATRDLTVAN